MGGDREKVVGILESWLGLKESDGSHKKIIDSYNAIKPLPAGYKMKYTDAWCAATASAAFHEAGLDSIFPSECSCSRMIEKAVKMGIWEESDSFVPSPGDPVLYDWHDSGTGDNKGNPDHVGITRKVSGGYIYVIEGNYSNAVKERKLKINGQFIRGFIRPKFDEEKKEEKKLVPMTKGVADSGVIWNFLKAKGLNEFGIAGLMGNLKAESGLKPTNLQNNSEKKLGLTDEEYTLCVDEGIYENFSKDAAGYGLAQWTYSSRKEALKMYADSKGASIGNLEMQLEFLWQELTTKYKGVLSVLKNAKSIQEASDIVLTQFERPADQGVSVKAKRAEYALEYYWKHTECIYHDNENAQADNEKQPKAEYKTGKNYTLAGNMFVRDAAAGNKKKFSQLTADGQAHAMRLADGTAVMKKGTVVTCKGVEVISDGAVWMNVPSGWICAISASGTIYIN